MTNHEPTNILPKNLFALSLTCGAITTKRNVREAELAAVVEESHREDSRKALTGRKSIIDSAHVAAVKAEQAALGERIRSLSVPIGDSLFKRGVYAVKAEAISEIETAVGKARARIEEHLAQIEADYPIMRQNAEERLAKLGMWRPEQFPTMQDIRFGARIEYAYHAISTPDTLATIDHDLFLREREKAKQAWEDAKAESVRALREEMAQIVEHLRDRLTPTHDGKPKIFRDTLLDNLRTFCDAFPLRDVTGDAELADVVASLRAVADSTPDAIRSNAALRERMARAVEGVAEIADELVTTAPVRKFRF